MKITIELSKKEKKAFKSAPANTYTADEWVKSKKSQIHWDLIEILDFHEKATQKSKVDISSI